MAEKFSFTERLRESTRQRLCSRQQLIEHLQYCKLMFNAPPERIRFTDPARSNFLHRADMPLGDLLRSRMQHRMTVARTKLFKSDAEEIPWTEQPRHILVLLLDRLINVLEGEIISLDEICNVIDTLHAEHPNILFMTFLKDISFFELLQQIFELKNVENMNAVELLRIRIRIALLSP